MTPEELRNVLEAAMLAAGRALSLDDFLALFEGSREAPDRGELRAALAELEECLEGRSLELVQVASGYRLQVRKEYSPWLGGLFAERPPRYSRALLETLALIAYRQPITRGEIEDVRGVAVSSNIIKTLMEREWIRVLGHKEVPGRPALYGTTRAFLDHFGLKSLEGLPALAEIRDLDQVEPDLFAGAPATDEGIVPAGEAPGAGEASPGESEDEPFVAAPGPGDGGSEAPAGEEEAEGGPGAQMQPGPHAGPAEEAERSHGSPAEGEEAFDLGQVREGSGAGDVAAESQNGPADAESPGPAVEDDGGQPARDPGPA